MTKSTMSIKVPRACKECGSSHLTWQTSIVNRSDVAQGRLNTRDVECLFFLGCDECSETLTTISADKVAGLMNANVAQSQESFEQTSAVAWPDVPGWYWAHGRIAGMREAALMSARAVMESDQLIVYVGEAMTHRLSFPDPELPLQFKRASLPQF